MASSITIIISPASHHQSIQCRCSICKMSHCLFLWINCSQTAISIILFEQNKSPPPSSFIQVATVSQYNKRSSRCRFAKNTLSSIDPINYHTEDTLIDHTTPPSLVANAMQLDTTAAVFSGKCSTQCSRVHVMRWGTTIHSFICRRWPVLDIDRHRDSNLNPDSVTTGRLYFHWSDELCLSGKSNKHFSSSYNIPPPRTIIIIITFDSIHWPNTDVLCTMYLRILSFE